MSMPQCGAIASQHFLTTFLEDFMAKKERYVIIRTRSAGVFAGTLIKRTGTDAQIKNSRRLWYWSGAASLSQLAVDGTSKPDQCKFPVAIPSHEVTEVLEVLDCTDKARQSIESVKVWKA